MVLRYVPGDLVTRSVELDGRQYVELSMSGADRLSVPGFPDLPVVRVVVAVPDCERVVSTVGTGGTARKRALPVLPAASIVPGAEGEVSSYAFVEGDVYSTEGRWPDRAAAVTDPRWTTTQRTVAVEFYPCQVDPGSGTLFSHESIEVSLSFLGVRDNGPQRADLPRRESLLRSVLLNYEDGKQWRRGRVARRLSRPDDYFTTSQNWVKMTVTEQGMHSVTHEDLQHAGLGPDDIDPGTFRVFSGGGLPVPDNVTEPRPDWMDECTIRVDDGGDGTFDDGDRVIFYALAIDGWSSELEVENPDEPYYENPFANDSAYWLTWEYDGTPSGFAGEPLRMAADDLQDEPDPLVVENYVAREHFERNIYEYQGRGDNWYWSEMRLVGVPETRYFHETLDHVLTDSTGVLRARTDGNSSVFSVNPDHYVIYSLNDTEAHIGEWDGFSRYTFEAGGLPMREGFNTYKVVVPREDQGHREDAILIDWFELEFWRELWAVDDHILFGSSARTGTIEHSIGGFAGDDVSVYKIIDKLTLRTVPGVSIEAGRAVFQDEVADTASYAAASADGYISPELEVSTFADLRTPSGADYIIVVYDGFHGEAVRLKNYRESSAGGGHDVQLVRTSDVYDEFSWGIFDPTAIRDFLKYAWDNADLPPTHVLLIGDASSDYRRYQSSSIESYVPTVYTGGGYWPTDQWFVGFESVSDYDPAMALGRMTARSTSELSTMIDKVERYETESVLDTWKNTVMLVGDDELKGWDDTSNPEYYHTEQAEQISTDILPWPIDRKKIYLMEYEHDAAGNKSGARRDIVDAWNEGLLVANYTGHGNELLMAHENVFLLDDVPRLHNLDGLPLFFAASCRLNKFDMKTGDSLGETLVKSSIGGAIASIGSTRDSGAGQNSILNRAFFSHTFDDQRVMPTAVLDVGSAFQAAFISTGTGHSQWVNNTRFALIGDPALTMASPSGGGTIGDDGLEPMKRMDTITIEGSNAGPTEGEGGVALITVTDSADTSGYDQWNPIFPPRHVDYSLPGKTMFDGPVVVTNGEFDAEFVVSALAEEGPYARIRGYFYSDDSDGSFSLEDVALSDSVAVTDATGPVIDVGFEGGGTSVLPGSEFTISLTDDHGVNLVDRDLEDGIVLRVAGSADTTSLTGAFLYDLGSYRTGSVDYALPSLGLGGHTLIVEATDNVGNRSTEDVWIEVVSAADFKIRAVANHPNPFSGGEEGTTILFQLPAAATVRIEVFTVGGRLIRAMSDIPATAGANEVYWNGLDQQGDELANGVYLYRIQATSEEYSGDKAEAIGRAVVMR